MKCKEIVDILCQPMVDCHFTGSNLSTVLVLCGDMAGNSASLRDSHALRLVSELPDLRAANVHRRRIRGSVRTGAHPSQQKRDAFASLFCWLGWPDLNRRMPESKSGALPLGDIPIFCQKVLYHRSLSLSRIFYLTLSFTFICSAPLIFKKRLRKVEFCGIL